MKNGTMFSEIGNYINRDFLSKNSKIFIYTKEGTYEGNIFVAYSKSVNEEINSTQNLSFYEKVKYYKNQNVYLENIEDDINKIVKLTTCSYINSTTTPTNQRYYVIAQIMKKN